jgi:GGDEF domain-containing protein
MRPRREGGRAPFANRATAQGIIVLNTRDVTERKALEQRLAHRAFHDALTGLPNRALLEDRVRKHSRAAAEPAAPSPLCSLASMTLKAINESLTHAGGDAVLHEVAQPLQTRARASDRAAR